MNELKTWTFSGSEVRTVEVNGESWWVLKDVCTVLEMDANRAGEVVKRLEQDEYDSIGLTDSLGREQKTYIVNESGLYSVILRSDKPKAKPFRKWVTSEVLPAIRKTGSYGVPTYADLSPQLQVLINIETKQREQERAIAETNRRIDSIGEVIALDVHSWRKDAQHLISKIATVNGGFDSMKDIYAEIYRLVEERAGVSLGTRLTNKRRRMADEGVCKSKRDKLTKVDIIADDKKLIEIYLAIVKELAIKSGVDMAADTAESANE